MKKLLLLYLFFIPLIICSCEKSTSNMDEILSDKISGVYREVIVPIPEGYAVQNAPEYENEMFVVELYLKDEKDGTLWMDRERQSISFDINAENIVVQSVNESFYMNSWEIGNAVFSSDEYFKVKYSSQGQLIATLDIPSIFHYDITNDISFSKYTQSAFSIIDIIGSKEGQYLILTTEGLCAINNAGKVCWVQMELLNPVAVIYHEKLGIIYLAEENGKQMLRRVKLDDGSIGEKIDLPLELVECGGIGGSDKPSFYPGIGAYDFYIANNIGLWGIQIKLMEETTCICTPIECINWLNSDIASPSISNLCIANEDTIAAFRYSNDQYQLVILKKVPENELPEYEILTIASLSEERQINQIIQHAIESFNRSNSEYRILLTDFTQYEKEQRKLLFNAEMSAGRVPDIVIMSTESNTDSVVDDYVKSNVFCDMLPLMKMDTTFHYNDLLGYVSKPYQDVEGKQYVFPLTPSAKTQFGTIENFEGPMTVDETFSMRNNLSEGVYWTNNDNAFQIRLLQSTMNDYIDWKAMTCNFNDGRLENVLKLCEEIPDDGAKEGLKTVDEQFIAMREGRLLLLAYDMNSLYRWFNMKCYIDNEIIPVGYPNSERQLYVENTSGCFYSITQASEHKSIAIDFLEYIFVSMSDNNYNSGNYAFYKQDIERQLQQYENQTFVFWEGKLAIYDDEDTENLPGTHFKLTKEDADEYSDFLNEIDAVLPTDSAVYFIYEEECFSDKIHTPEEIADIIQSRVSIYLSERS